MSYFGPCFGEVYQIPCELPKRIAESDFSVTQHNFPVFIQSGFLNFFFWNLVKGCRAFPQNVPVSFILKDALLRFKRETSCNIIGKLKKN